MMVPIVGDMLDAGSMDGGTGVEQMGRRRRGRDGGYADDQPSNRPCPQDDLVHVKFPTAVFDTVTFPYPNVIRPDESME
jgi:hypothetical protein